jgi:hypothetical protein
MFVALNSESKHETSDPHWGAFGRLLTFQMSEQGMAIRKDSSQLYQPILSRPSHRAQ